MKWKRVAEIYEKDQAEKRKPLIQKSTNENFQKRYENSNPKVNVGNCSKFIQEPGPIKSLGKRQLIIDTPGNYFFSEDISWNPNHCPNQAAIVILADNVTLDLKGFSLKAQYADTNQQFTGISILAAKNVIIKNGTISGMTYYGIKAELSQNVIIDGVKIKEMNYYNISQKDSTFTPCGMLISGVNKFAIKNSYVQNLSTTSSSCAGIQVLYSKNGTLLNNSITRLTNHDGSVQGFSYINCDSIETINCHSSIFQSHYKGLTKTLGHTVVGFIPSLCNFLKYENCSAEDMIGSCDDCHGMSIFLDSSVTINNFSAKRIVDGAPPYRTGAKATGLEIYGYDITVTNSIVDSIIAIEPQDLQSAGFSAWGNNITFQNCISQNVIVQNREQKPDLLRGYGTGFGWAPDPRPEFDTVTANNVTYINCKAINCQLGFDTWNHTNSTWKNTTTQDCGIPILIQSNNVTRTLTMNKCSESPYGNTVSVTLTNKAKNNNIIKGNKKKK